MPIIPFSGSPLDRADHVRRDDKAVAALKDAAKTRFLLLDNLKVALTEDARSLYWAKREEVIERGPCVFLGLKGEMPCFAATAATSGLPVKLVEARLAAGSLSGGQAGTVAAARSLLLWHEKHPFCAACGQPTRMAKGGWARLCPDCHTEVYPRVDPVVIMLPEYEDRVLIGRQPGFPEKFWSALAGFVEPGETFEEAVRREIREEAGIRCGEVSYVGSQPWPFAASLMLGAFTQALESTFSIDHDELEAVRWVSREEVRAALNGEGDWSPPPEIAIARHLLEAWVAHRPVL